MLGLENYASKRFSEKKPLQDLTDNCLLPSAPYKAWDLEVRIPHRHVGATGACG
jgi:hypothetical protein